MLKSKNYIENDEASLDKEDIVPTTNLLPNRYRVQLKFCGKDCEEKSSILINDLTNEHINKCDQIVDNNTLENVNNDVDHEMYDIIDSTNAFTTVDLNDENNTDNTEENSIKLTDDLIEESTIKDTKAIFDEYYHAANDAEELNSLDLCSNPIDNSSIEQQKDSFDLSSGVGECSKVYTHKKRKSVDEKKTISINNILPESLTTDCIDLSEDISCDITPVTLPSALDMETTDYIWNLSSEVIHNVIGSTINQEYTLNIVERQTEFDIEKSANKGIRQIKELFAINRNIARSQTPVLRRSVRLNQLEMDDTVNNNSDTTTKPRHKEQFKSKRKNREIEIRTADENSVTSKKNLNNSRSLRSAAKFTSKSSSSNSRSLSSRLTKDEKNPKAGRKLKSTKLEKIESLENDIFVPQKLNTIATVDRALWGDMSDYLENYENGIAELPEHSLSKEIPFAVGLLPLHAALERMQAMPDYQPRKTRSSFAAPLKQDNNVLKRKGNNIDYCDTIVTAKKQCSPEQFINEVEDEDNSSTVCHIQIHTSSQCSQNRRNVNDQLVSVDDTRDDKR